MKKGFTLLELIIVIIIIGILASFALPRYIRAAERARAAEGVSVLDVLRSAQLRYYARHGGFANSIDDTDTDITTPQYFTIEMLDTGTGEENDDIVVVTRNDEQCPDGYEGYTLTIEVDGDIRCGGGPGGGGKAICKKLGYL